MNEGDVVSVVLIMKGTYFLEQGLKRAKGISLNVIEVKMKRERKEEMIKYVTINTR